MQYWWNFVAAPAGLLINFFYLVTGRTFVSKCIIILMEGVTKLPTYKFPRGDSANQTGSMSQKTYKWDLYDKNAYLPLYPQFKVVFCLNFYQTSFFMGLTFLPKNVLFLNILLDFYQIEVFFKRKMSELLHF